MPRCSRGSRANPKGPAHPERAGGGPAGRGDAAESGMEAEAVARFRPSKGFLLETASREEGGDPARHLGTKMRHGGQGEWVRPRRSECEWEDGGRIREDESWRKKNRES